MLNSNNFVIFANARSGSTSLAKLLGCSEDVQMSIEPFHPSYSEWNPGERNYSKFVDTPEKMSVALEELFEKYSAIKVLQHQFPKEIYFQMLKTKNLKIIFLTRDNLVELAISRLVAGQTSIWQKEDQKDKEVFTKLAPIDLDEIQEMIKYIAELVEIYTKFLQENRVGEYLHLKYESLYSSDMERNMNKVAEICDFLGVKLPSRENIEKYMLPSSAKINYANVYRNIPNLSEIEDKYGPLFI